MRPVNRGRVPLDENGDPKVYKEYGYARRDLIKRMGEFCSYCEVRLPASLAVEHVRPKSLNPNLETDWDNFLLACTNCNSIKGKRDIDLEEFVWPDRHNTSLIFKYEDNGFIKPVKNLSVEITERAKALLDLVGLNRTTSAEGTNDYDKASDRRFENRLSAILHAYESVQLLEEAPDNAKDSIIQLLTKVVQSGGFWSIYMMAFKNHPEVRRSLIQALPGTRQEFFNENGEPVD